MSLDRGSVNLDELANELLAADGTFYVRSFIALADDGEWQVRHSAVAIGEDLPNWEDAVWRYARARFVAGTMQARDVVALCGLGESSSCALDGLLVVVPRSHETAGWRREPSLALHDRTPVSWPSRNFSVTPADPSGQEPECAPLVGIGCPSFYDLRTAFRAFFEGNYSLIGAGSLPTPLAEVRLLDMRGAIGKVHVAPAAITVEIAGRQLEQATLELFDQVESHAVDVDGPEVVTIPLGLGPPEQGWLWLKRGHEWLDYRPLIAPWLRSDGNGGVDVEIAEDPQAVVEGLIASGEGPRVEFKSRLPDSPAQRRSAFKTVAAFANGSGGTVIFGVDPDEVTVVGLDGEPNKLRDDLANLVRARVAPTPPFEVTSAQIDGAIVLLLHVGPGPSTPYGITVDKGHDRPEFYVRRGASTYPAQPSDIREAVFARPGP